MCWMNLWRKTTPQHHATPQHLTLQVLTSLDGHRLPARCSKYWVNEWNSDSTEALKLKLLNHVESWVATVATSWISGAFREASVTPRNPCATQASCEEHLGKVWRAEAGRFLRKMAVARIRIQNSKALSKDPIDPQGGEICTFGTQAKPKKTYMRHWRHWMVLVLCSRFIIG